MKKKCVRQYIRQKDQKMLMELKAFAANPQSLAGWSVFTRYVIIGEIIHKLDVEELKSLLCTLHDATSETVTELARRIG